MGALNLANQIIHHILNEFIYFQKNIDCILKETFTQLLE
jgi:hypothetical protein